MKQCSACKESINKKATKCPYCQTKQPAGFAAILIVSGIIVVVILVISNASNSTDSRNRAEVQDQADASEDYGFGFALGVAQGFVKDQLKAPRSAKWPGLFERAGHTSALGNNRYRIRSWVDSQNSFGALLRMNYTAIVRDNGSGNWSLESLTMDE